MSVVCLRFGPLQRMIYVLSEFAALPELISSLILFNAPYPKFQHTRRLCYTMCKEHGVNLRRCLIDRCGASNSCRGFCWLVNAEPKPHVSCVSTSITLPSEGLTSVKSHEGCLHSCHIPGAKPNTTSHHMAVHQYPNFPLIPQVKTVANNLGTADAVRAVSGSIRTDHFVLLSSDLVTDLPLRTLIAAHYVRGSLVSSLLDPSRVSPSSETKPGKVPKNVDYIGAPHRRNLVSPAPQIQPCACHHVLLTQSAISAGTVSDDSRGPRFRLLGNVSAEPP